MKHSRRKKSSDSECTVAPRVPVEKLEEKFFLSKPANEARNIKEYVEVEAPDEKVLHLEKVKTERVFDVAHDCWDVLTNKTRWWVITSPTNLYDQALFPSLDYTLSFHVGLMARVATRSQRSIVEPNRKRLMTVWRKLQQAFEALDRADEPEQFQAVGMCCRETLLRLVKELADPRLLAEGETSPKSGDFVTWSGILARWLCPGSSLEPMRDHLKTIAKTTWQFVQWLTHASGATRFHAVTAVHATENAVGEFLSALMRFESGMPARCPHCESYRLTPYYQPESGSESGYVTVCDACDWDDSPKKADHRKAAH